MIYQPIYSPLGEICRAVMTGTLRDNNTQPLVPFNISTVENVHFMETVNPFLGAKHG